MRSMKRMTISVIGFILTAVIFGTATYAWIGLATVNSIDGVYLTATTGNFLEISLDGINYSQSVDPNELEDIFGNVELIDVTSIDGQTFMTGGLKSSDEAEANKHYLSFILYFRTVEKEKDLFLVNNVNNIASFDTSPRGTFVVSRGVTWRATHTFANGPEIDDIVERGDPDTYYAADAVRLSLVEEVNSENVIDERDQTDLNTVIYDPSEDETRGFGKTYGAYSFFINKTGQYTYRIPDIAPNTIYSLTTFEPFDPYQAQNNNSHFATLVPNGETNDEDRPWYAAKVRVNVWIEGWDADAFDAIDRDRIKIQLEFKTGNKA
ncbi:MAG: hypothetical protein K9K93_05620 [Acholeplasmataceae bacterium]|nr:hypothetical protein [Acholeplasmataceae bacterium]